MFARLIIALVFHHDGPFDACNPHRNRKGSSRAPMQAFPKDSLNTVLGGSGPVRQHIDLATIHGHQADPYSDFDLQNAQRPQTAVREVESTVLPPPQYRPAPAADRGSNFNPTAKVVPVHGDESLGLGTSTFLEGAPAARAAIQRRESDTDQTQPTGLGRKKSLAQKIRGIGGSGTGRSGSMNRPLAGNGMGSPEAMYETPASPDGVQSAGGLPKIAERNPFFTEYGDKKGGVRVQEGSAVASPGEGTFEGEPAEAAMTSPRAGMTRRATEGAMGSGDDGEGKGGGFLSRVKSLRGGGRSKARIERRE